jgi:hypothetical protein
MHAEIIMVAMNVLMTLSLFNSTKENIGNSAMIMTEWWNK